MVRLGSVLAQAALPTGAAAAVSTAAVQPALGVPLWVWIAVAIVVVVLLVALLSRRKRKQAVITTRHG